MSADILRFPIERTGSVWPLGMSDQEIADALNADLVMPLVTDRLVALWRRGDVARMPGWIAEGVQALARSVG